MKLQLISDIHLEHLEEDNKNIFDFSKILIPSAPILLMAGDISTYDCKLLSLFLLWISERFENVFWILGNHEFYNTEGLNMTDITIILRRLCPKNILILDNEHIIIGDVLFIGSTLWSEVPLEYMHKIQRKLNDYKYIYHNDKLINCKDTNDLYKKSVAYIRETLNKNKNNKLVIITHHAPSIYDTIEPKYRGDKLNYAFASNIILENSLDVIWCYGHTHYNVNMNKQKNGYKLISNQYGYEGEHSGCLYRDDYTFEI